jgi:hypothetical protein
MATPINYTSSSDVATYIPQLNSDASTNTNDLLALLIGAKSRDIDDYTQRRFYSSTADETVYFDGNDSARLMTPLDIVSLTSLSVAMNTVAAASGSYTVLSTQDYFLRPSMVRDGWPYMYVELTDQPVGTYTTSRSYTTFPYGHNTIKAVGKFGWASTAITDTNFPKAVRYAATELVVRAWRAKDANFADTIGVEGLGVATFSKAMPQDVAMILERYKRDVIG